MAIKTIATFNPRQNLLTYPKIRERRHSEIVALFNTPRSCCVLVGGVFECKDWEPGTIQTINEMETYNWDDYNKQLVISNV